MADEEREEQLFDRQQAEQLLPQLERLLTHIIEQKKQVQGIEQELSQVQNRILLYGGIVPPYAYLAEKKARQEKLVKGVREAMEEIEQTGCVVKDIDQGLIDFPSVVNDEQVYLCWKLGEDAIRYWHRIDEGFASRKRLAPADGAPPDKPKIN